MALYEHLLIYNSAINLVLEIEKTVRNMSLYNKNGIGIELRKRSHALLSFKILAISKDKSTNNAGELNFGNEDMNYYIQNMVYPYRAFIDFQSSYIRIKPYLCYKYLILKDKISFLKKDFLDHNLIINKGRFYEIIKTYYGNGKKQFRFRLFRITKFLHTLNIHFMSGVFIRKMGEITDKIKVRINISSWRLKKPIQLQLCNR